MSTPEERGVQCKYLLPDGRCNLDKRRNCDYYPGKFETIEAGQMCEHCSIFGNFFFTITPQQIEDLKAGKILFHRDEYGIFIRLGEEV